MTTKVRIGRHGTRGATTGCRAMSMGSHLSRRVQAGRWLVPAVCHEEVVEVVGRLRLGQVLEEARELPLEAFGRHHANCPPGTWIAGVASSAAIETRIAPSDRWRRDLAVPSGMPRVARHLGQRHPQEVVQDDDRAPLGIEVAERVVEQLAVGDRGRRRRRWTGRGSGSARPRSRGGVGDG